MEITRHEDIKTTRKILGAELVLIIAFIVLLNFSSWVGDMLVGLVILSFVINIAWAIQLLTNRPPGYGKYALFMLLMCVAIPIGVLIYAISGTTC